MGGRAHRKQHGSQMVQTRKSNKTVDELTSDELEILTAQEMIDEDGNIKSTKGKLIAVVMLPFLGLINDFIVMWIGGPAIIIYSKLWWGAFFPAQTIFNFFGAS